MRSPRAARTVAFAVVAAGVSLPLLRRRARLHPAVVLCGAALAPIALSVATRRTRTRDVAVVCMQMWAYAFAYKMPHDNPGALEARVHMRYPIVIDRMLGLGELPSARLQRALYKRPGTFTRLDKVLVWTHWLWFFAPHSAIAYILLRHRERLPRAAALMYGTFDTGALLYWLIPTAPPWYAVERGLLPREELADPAVRRMMAEYGEVFWRERWGPLYSVFGGNPLAAMPSLHFASSLMGAMLLTETDAIAAGVGWSYVMTLGFALVYLGEHYAVDLLGGAALAGAVWSLGPRAGPLLSRVRRAVAALEARVVGEG